MLLARRGRRVLLVDRASFPSDTVSAHAIQPAGVARLLRWGLGDVLHATGAPWLDTVRFDAGDVVLEGTPLPVDGVTSLVAPRRDVLDGLLVEAAGAAGAEVRTGFSVRDLIVEGGRVVGVRGDDRNGSHELRARLVVGADGVHSMVARRVAARRYHAEPAATIAAYTYYRGVDCDRVELYARPNRFVVAHPTNDDRVIVTQGIALHDAPAFRADIAAGFDATLASLPSLAERIASGERVERFRLATDTGGFYRVPHGPGWALVGDAGYHKDPITAQGMLDAFRDAELLAEAIDNGVDGDLDSALAGYHAARDRAVGDMYAFTCELAKVHQPPSPMMRALLHAIDGDPAQISRFLGLIAGSVSVAEYLSPQNIAAIVDAPAAAVA
jgi:flavin-dependent dehydrogenase